MKKILKRIFIMFCLISMVAGGLYLYFNTDLLRIKTIEFNSNEHVDLYDIQRYSGIEIGMPYFEIDAFAATQALATHPYIKSAKLTKVFPNTVKFEVVYRVHYFNIRYSDILLSLDSQLHVLEVLATENEGYTVEGFAFESFSTGKVIDVSQLYILENIVSLISLLEQSEVKPNTLIRFEDRNIILDMEGIKAKFGVGENIEGKFNDFVNIYETLKSDGVVTGVIDVSTDGLPVYRPFGE